MRHNRVLLSLLTTLLLIGSSIPSQSDKQALGRAGNSVEPASLDGERSEVVVKLPDVPALHNHESADDTYYTIKRDLRRCASPLCGGYWVSAVNLAKTKCVDGKSAAQCYVADIDWNGQTGFADSGPRGEAKALLRGTIVRKADQRFDKLGSLRVTESWMAGSERASTGSFYRVRDLGVRCITHPCPTHQETKLNTPTSRKIAGVDLSGAATDDQVSQAQEAMTGPEGIIATGVDVPVKGPAGKSFTLKASQFFLRAKASTSANDNPAASKSCIRTGCSGIICADEERMSTCEWKEEYACYKTARCERQSNGKCGFTQTQELTLCLRSKRK